MLILYIIAFLLAIYLETGYIIELLKTKKAKKKPTKEQISWIILGAFVILFLIYSIIDEIIYINTGAYLLW